MENSPPLPNPYIGPTSIQRGQPLYGRDRDLRRLVDLLIVNRLVLLHSPSGAGKTSLIQAGLLPEIERNDFWLPHPLQGARMNFIVQQPLAIGQIPDVNPFRLSLLVTLDEGLQDQKRPPEALSGLTIQNYLAERLERAKTDKPVLLVIDQFEEILTHDPHNLKPKIDFFVELAGVLQDRRYWALLSMRDDFLGPMEPLLARLPTGFSTRFHLDLLNEQSSKEAIQKPARWAEGPDRPGVDFTDDAAQALFDDLSKVSELKPDGTIEEKGGQFVEPVQLQVVCYNLWEKLQPRSGGQIVSGDVSQAGYVDATLGEYYAKKVAEIAGLQARAELNIRSDTEANTRQVEFEAQSMALERRMRSWFERDLITTQKIRSQVMMSYPLSPPDTGIPTDVIWKLTGTFLVRADSRRGLTFFELTHDRLVRPIFDDNNDWRSQRADKFNDMAARWEAAGRPAEQLLIGPVWKDFESWSNELKSFYTPAATVFFNACQRLNNRLTEQAQPVKLSSIERQTNLADLGWGIIYPAGLDPAILYALSPLREHRYQQATARNQNHYKEFIYNPSNLGQNNETAQQFLSRNGAGAGPVDPEKVPYYLLIIGSPQEIPFEFQYGLDVQYAVGRLAFDTPYEYYTYARSVLAIENGEAAPLAVAALAAAQPAGSSDSLMVSTALLGPMSGRLSAQPPPGWQVETLSGPQLNKEILSSLLNGPEAPGLLFLAAPTPPPEIIASEQKLDLLGAMQMSEFLTGQPPSQANNSELPKMDQAVFSAADLSDSANLLGMIVFLYGPYTGGAPGHDDYTHRPVSSPTATSPDTAFVAHLPQKLLSHPNGAALAAFAHVERSGAYSFSRETPLEEYTVFLETLRRIMLGYTAGAAKELLDQRYALFLSQLGERLSRAGQLGRQSANAPVLIDAEFSSLLTTTIDARNYILLGDPAARLPDLSDEAISALPRQLPERSILKIPENLSGVNVRSNPSIQSEILAVAPPGCIMETIGESAKQGWWQVRWFTWQAEVQIGWITEDYAKVDIAGVGPIISETIQPAPEISPVVDLEITLTTDGTAPNYNIEVGLTIPGSDAEIRMPRSPVPLKLAELEALRPNLTAYSAALSKQLYAQPAIDDIQARAGSSARSLGVPLRLRLSIDPDSDMLAGTTWELLHTLLEGQNLLLESTTWFSRYLWNATWESLALRPFGNPGALLAIANPRKRSSESFLPDILAGEPFVEMNTTSLKSVISKAIAPLMKQTLKPLTTLPAPLTLESLMTGLSGGYPIFFLICRAVRVDSSGLPLYVVLENDKGESTLVQFSKITDYIKSLPTERRPTLAVLCTLETKKPSAKSPVKTSEVLNPLTLLAPRLAAAGIPAILAFQGLTSLDLLKVYLPVFFEQIARTGLVDRSAASARAAVARRADYWRPALFSRVKNGQIWLTAETAFSQEAVFARPVINLGLPPPPIDQIERPVLLDQLRHTLIDPVQINQPVALLGLPGSGKTALAVTIANDDTVRQTYPDGVIFESFGETPDLKGILGRWLSALTNQEKKYSDLSEASKDLAAALDQRRLLLVLDDVNAAEHLGPFLAGGVNCKRLITSNNRSVLPLNTRMITVDRMELSEALQLLGRRLPQDELGSLMSIAKLLGFWPLALNNANQLLLRYYQPGRRLQVAADYLRSDLENRGLVALNVPGAGGAAGLSLTQYIAASLTSLSPTDRQALDALSVFPPQEAIPFPAVLRLWNVNLRLDESAARDQLRRLWNVSLIETGDAEFANISMQNLLQRFLSEQIGPPISQLHAGLLDAYGVEKWTQWSPDEPYIWEHTSYHLQRAGRSAFLAELLLNLKWLQARLTHGGIVALLGDYDVLPDDATLQRLRKALRLSAYQLDLNPDLLSAQLLGRLLGYADTDPRLRALLEQARRAETTSLLPLSPTLDNPDGARLGMLPYYPGNQPILGLTGDGRMVLFAKDEKVLIVWDIDRWQQVAALEHPDKFMSASIIPDPQRPLALTSAADYMLRLWDLSTGENISSLLVPTPEGNSQTVPISGGGGLITIDPGGRWIGMIESQNRLLVWKIDTQELLIQIAMPESGATALAAAGSEQILVGTSSGEIYCYDLTGKLVQSWQEHPAAIKNLAVSVDGAQIYSLGEEGKICYRDISGKSKPGEERHIYSDAIYRSLSIRADSLVLAAGSDQGILSLSIKNPTIKSITSMQLYAHSSAIIGLEISTDGTRLLSASNDGILNIWELNQITGGSSAAAYPLRAVSYPTGGPIVSIDDYGLLKTWDASSWVVEGLSKGRLLRAIPPLPGYERRPGVGPAGMVLAGGRRALVALNDGHWIVWDLDQGISLTPSVGESDILVDLELDSQRYQVIVWNQTRLPEPGPIETIPTEFVQPYQSVPEKSSVSDGNEAGSISYIQFEIDPSAPLQLSLFDADVLRRSLLLNTRSDILRSHNGTVNAWITLPDGERAASAGEDGVIKIWDTVSGKLLLTLEGHTAAVQALAAFKDNRRLLSVSRDATLRIWDLDSASEMDVYHADYPLLACSVSETGDLILAGDSTGNLHLLSYSVAFEAPPPSSVRFEPQFKYLWQNPTLRSLVYPTREGALRDTLDLLNDINYYRTSFTQTASIKFSDRTRLAANYTTASVELKRLAHDDLLTRLLAQFNQTGDFPDWLKVMLVHYAGMRSGSAHGSWADPIVLFDRLADTARKRLAEPNFRQKTLKEAQNYWKGRAKASLSRTSKRPVNQIIKGLIDPVRQEDLLVDYLIAKDVTDANRNPTQNAYDRLLVSKDRLGFPTWFWREVVRLTDLRLAIASGDWLNDWESLSFAELTDRSLPENEPWRDAIQVWQRPLDAWRDQHQQDLHPRITRLLCNEAADLVYHLRGIKPAYGLSGRALWLDKLAQENSEAYFRRLAGPDDLRPGASLFRQAWINRLPYPWEAAITRPELALIDKTDKISREAGWEITRIPVPEGRMLTRRRTAAQRAEWRLYNVARQTEPAESTQQFLIWSSEAIVVTVIDAFGNVDGPVVITLEAAPNIMLKRIPLKKLLSEWGIWVGYAPNGSLDDQQRSAFESLLDPSSSQIQTGRAIQADIPHSELRPEWTYPNSVRELTMRTASLSQPARTLAILLAYDQNPEQIAAAIPSFQELQLPQVSPEDIQSLMASLSPALQSEFPELLAGLDFGQDQPHSSP